MNFTVTLKWTLMLLILGGISACATTTQIDVTPNAPTVPMHTVYLVTHGGSSGDVDSYIRHVLLHRGLTETEGMDDVIQNKNVDLVVKYDDHWKWDLSMYLKTIDIQFFDGKTGALIAESSWQNSAMHGFHSAEDVVNDLMTETFEKLSATEK